MLAEDSWVKDKGLPSLPHSKLHEHLYICVPCSWSNVGKH
jgi:hypothetical protein